MQLVLHQIEANAGISNTTFHRRCQGRQGYWWLKSSSGEFVKIGSHRGDQSLKLDLDLTPGVYTLGCGPSGKHGHREMIEVVDVGK